MGKMIEYMNSYGAIYKIPKKSLAFLKTRDKKHVEAEVKELMERIKQRHTKGATISQHNAALELGVKMELIREVFTDLITTGTLEKTGRDRFVIK